MNFASHHFFQATGSALFDAGLLLADLIPLAGGKRQPLLPVIKSILCDSAAPDDEIELARGLDAHFRADLVFHRSQFFADADRALADDSRVSSSIPPILYHILIEICMDRFLVYGNPSLVSGMYNSFDGSYRRALSILGARTPIDDNVASLCALFASNRTILRYTDPYVITEALGMIGARAGLRIRVDDIFTAGVGAAYMILEESVRNYFESAKTVYREIGAATPSC